MDTYPITVITFWLVELVIADMFLPAYAIHFSGFISWFSEMRWNDSFFKHRRHFTPLNTNILFAILVLLTFYTVFNIISVIYHGNNYVIHGPWVNSNRLGNMTAHGHSTMTAAPRDRTRASRCLIPDANNSPTADS